MTRRRSHWRDISKQQLQWMLALLKDMDGPKTQGDIRDELKARGLERKIEAIPTIIWEIGQNKDAGYETSGGVRFPDGQYRYWLIKAPGWTPRWRVTKDFKIVPYEEAGQGDMGTWGHGVEAGHGDKGTWGQGENEEGVEEKKCPECGAKTDGGFCDDGCKDAFFEKLRLQLCNRTSEYSFPFPGTRRPYC